MKKLVTIIILLVAITSFAQQSIQTSPAYKGKSKFSFTDEWQYLSTDIYLFNTNKFNELINQIVQDEKISKGRKVKKGDEEFIESLFITAKIKDLKFFGGDLTYPIYNFQVKIDETSKYKTQVTSNMEVVRIIDNLPLASSKDYIDAIIQGQVISSKNKTFLDQLISSQLLSISTITNPSAAVLGLVGEFGKLMNSKTNGLQYSFNSTIRLYEGQDFNKRLHSVYVYVFLANANASPEINTQKLEQYLDTVNIGNIDHKKLSTLISCPTNPYIVIANFKSKYLTESVTGDEVNFESINKRAQRTKQAYEQGLMNKETYLQEMKFIEFLQSFARLKVDIDNYKLNYKNNITNNFAQNYFVILSEYRNLKNIHRNRELEFAKESIYKNEFRQKYISIIMNAELYLEADNSLKNIKECVNTLYDFENTPNISLSTEKRENYLRKLNSVELPKTEIETNEAKDISTLVKQLEQEQFDAVFSSEIQKLKSVPANDENLLKTEILKQKSNSTSCKYCKEQVQQALNEFQDRYETNQIGSIQKKLDEQIKRAKDVIYNALINETCINQYLEKNYPDIIGKPEHIKMIISDFVQVCQQRISLNENIKQNLSGKKLSEYENHIENLQNQMNTIKETYSDICTKLKNACECQ